MNTFGSFFSGGGGADVGAVAAGWQPLFANEYDQRSTTAVYAAHGGVLYIMTKYNARKTIVDGITFDSQKEAYRYGELKLLELAGEISELQLQPRFLLQEGFKDKSGKRHSSVNYVADFQYVENGIPIIEDVKGMETPVFRLKKKLFLYRYPHLHLRISGE